ncbi:MAG: hypothetical protein AAF636_08320 [Pseudomonadota bacterium]
MTTRRTRRTRGYMLITVLWVGLALLMSLSAYLSTARQKALTVRAEVATSRAVELARSGLNVALADLGRVDPSLPTSRRDNSPVRMSMAEGTVTYRVMDEVGKVDLLRAPTQLLAPILVKIAEREGVDAFAAAGAAETLQTLASSPRGAALSVYDLMRRIGLSPQSALASERYLTTFNFTPRVNPRTAPRAVLESIPGIGISDVEAVLAKRETGGNLPRLGTASVWLLERPGPVYRVQADARLASGAEATIITHVAQRGLAFRGGLMQYDILSYRIER